MATKIGEDTNVQLDLKTIGMIIVGTISLASMWFTLQSDIDALRSKVENFSGDEFVQKMEFQLKDELIRSTIVQIDKSTKDLKDDIEENKEAIKKNSEKFKSLRRLCSLNKKHLDAYFNSYNMVFDDQNMKCTDCKYNKYRTMFIFTIFYIIIIACTVPAISYIISIFFKL